MTDPDFPEELRAFIRDHITDVDAVELLLLLARDRDRTYDIAALVADLRPSAITEMAVRKHLAVFEERGLVTSSKEGRCRYSPVRPELDAVVRALSRVYNERPVTLVRMIYALKDEKIRSFADAFRLKKS
jgi:predicted ArsR family transcriptional regulator